MVNTPQESTAPDGAESPETTSGRVEKKPRPFWRELPILILVALMMSFLLQTFIVRVYQIPSGSMEETLLVGDRIAVEKISYRFGDPQPGDVIVFKGPESWNTHWVSNRSSNVVVRGLQEVGSLVGLVPPDENDLVKRVIATGGQTVECCDDQGRILVDGKPLDEPYVDRAENDFKFEKGILDCDTQVKSGRCFGPITVPEGNFWMMGDHRNNSMDSRYHVGDEFNGSVPRENVIGKAVAIVLPPSRWGTIDSPDIQGK
ncbi:signal peptidase I [Rhodococcus sp. NPDC058514]|uniref:signal peptidase I n=1 Tax=unclassified Rhodococcus (in: high G+C Gram-positive bacteria) TaxID=192944 RepID=UPI00366597CF